MGCKILLVLFSFCFCSNDEIQLVGWNVAASSFVCAIYGRKLLYSHLIPTSKSERESLNFSLSSFQRFYRFILFIYETPCASLSAFRRLPHSSSTRKPVAVMNILRFDIMSSLYQKFLKYDDIVVLTHKI